MKIDSIQITNFRGIRHASLAGLGTMVVIAGANGSGKSCVFDAIRLIKSIYGGYQQNEWHHWMSEFQIAFNGRNANLTALLNDRTKPLQITVVFRLHPNEREYLRQNGKELVRQSVWRVIAPELYGWGSFNAAPMAAQLRVREPEVEAQTDQQFQILMHELSGDTLTGELKLADELLHITQSAALELIFGTFLPKELGVIDYHGPQRFFAREVVQNINLNLDAQEQQQSAHALYNYSNKYNTVKTEMASAFVKEIIADKAGVTLGSHSTLTNTLKELFEKFFPGKTFLGPQARRDGALDFPVRTADGSTHDLNDLSAGEKEILFGYLRIRNSAPRYSVILVDEPELHLNPRLVRGLPQFYNQHLGTALDNQVWLVTHSDAILREVVGQPEYSLFHMEPPSASKLNESQAKPMTAREDIERAVLNLVGDLAAYRPGGKVVVFEGGGDSEFDQEFTGTLFPKFRSSTNFISGGNRSRVRQLHEVLERVADKGQLPFKVYSVGDRDAVAEGQLPSSSFVWDVYHIENYLLEARFIFEALDSVGIKTLPSDIGVYEALRDSARMTLPDLVRQGLRDRANASLISALNLRTDSKSDNLAETLRSAIDRSMQRVTSVIDGPLALDKLKAEEDSLRAGLEFDLSGDSWRKTFRGRDILRRFAGTHAHSIPYDNFRNLIISRMRDAEWQPVGMKAIVQKIMDD